MKANLLRSCLTDSSCKDGETCRGIIYGICLYGQSSCWMCSSIQRMFCFVLILSSIHPSIHSSSESAGRGCAGSKAIPGAPGMGQDTSHRMPVHHEVPWTHIHTYSMFLGEVGENCTRRNTKEIRNHRTVMVQILWLKMAIHFVFRIILDACFNHYLVKRRMVKS